MRVAMNETRWVEVRKAAMDRLRKCEQESLCVACLEPLGDEKPIRGCHVRCYHATRRAIQAGKCTEHERVTSGKLHAGRMGRPPKNPVTIECT